MTHGLGEQIQCFMAQGLFLGSRLAGGQVLVEGFLDPFDLAAPVGQGVVGNPKRPGAKFDPGRNVFRPLNTLRKVSWVRSSAT